jgi:hypothetical protein
MTKVIFFLEFYDQFYILCSTTTITTTNTSHSPNKLNTLWNTCSKVYGLFLPNLKHSFWDRFSCSVHLCHDCHLTDCVPPSSCTTSTDTWTDALWKKGWMQNERTWNQHDSAKVWIGNTRKRSSEITCYSILNTFSYSRVKQGEQSPVPPRFCFPVTQRHSKYVASFIWVAPTPSRGAPFREWQIVKISSESPWRTWGERATKPRQKFRANSTVQAFQLTWLVAVDDAVSRPSLTHPEKQSNSLNRNWEIPVTSRRQDAVSPANQILGFLIGTHVFELAPSWHRRLGLTFALVTTRSKALAILLTTTFVNHYFFN